jgi:hypothetical protein
MSIYEQITGAGQDFVDWRKRGDDIAEIRKTPQGILGSF